MRRLIVCCVLLVGLPLLGATYQVGKCSFSIDPAHPSFWQWAKMIWTLNTC